MEAWGEWRFWKCILRRFWIIGLGTWSVYYLLCCRRGELYFFLYLRVLCFVPIAEVIRTLKYTSIWGLGVKWDFEKSLYFLCNYIWMVKVKIGLLETYFDHSCKNNKLTPHTLTWHTQTHYLSYLFCVVMMRRIESNFVCSEYCFKNSQSIIPLLASLSESEM